MDQLVVSKLTWNLQKQYLCCPSTYVTICYVDFNISAATFATSVTGSRVYMKAVADHFKLSFWPGDREDSSGTRYALDLVIGLIVILSLFQVIRTVEISTKEQFSKSVRRMNRWAQFSSEVFVTVVIRSR